MTQKGTIESMGSGFGKIKAKSGEIILFDITKCIYEGPEPGDQVEFGLKQGWDGKPRAIDVSCPDKPSKV
jgi:cold shock CspA family protein